MPLPPEFSISDKEICSHWVCSVATFVWSLAEPPLKLVEVVLLLSAEKVLNAKFWTKSLQDGLSTQVRSPKESSKYAFY